MTDPQLPSVGKALLDVPIGEMVLSLGQAIADAQHALDMNSLLVAQMMTGSVVDGVGEDGKPRYKPTTVQFDGQKVSLMELGFTPTFYQFAETKIEIKIAISMSTGTQQSSSRTDIDAEVKANAGISGLGVSGSASMNATTINASYASKFNYSAEGSSLISTRLVPVPPPAILEERIRKLLDRKVAERDEQAVEDEG